MYCAGWFLKRYQSRDRECTGLEAALESLIEIFEGVGSIKDDNQHELAV
jgi:hypothetical protein